MGEKVKILLVGLGSIGRRHLAHLTTFEEVELAALRTAKGTRSEKTEITEFNSLEEALAFQPSGVIISNPTSLHVVTALPFLQIGAKVLIEKPLAENLQQAEVLKLFKEHIRVAYCMRFLPLISFLSDIFKNDPPFKVSFKRSFYLPNWHPYADYRKEYTAIKKLGGGVIRTLSHEIDLSCYWFGKPVSVTGVTDTLSFLEIDTDDFAFFTMKCSTGVRVNFELDFFSPINVNEGEAITRKGRYFWNLEGVWFTAYNHNSPEKLIENSPQAFDTMYRDQMRDLLRFIRSGDSQNATYCDGLSVLEIIHYVERKY